MAKLDQILVKGTTYEIVPEVAPLFNTSTAYAVGDYVIKDAVLYRFKTAHASGAWNASQVDEVTAGSELKSIKNDKLDKNQGTANAGKYLKVSANGNVETVELDITTDTTLSIANKAADAKAVGDEIDVLKADLSAMYPSVDSSVFEWTLGKTISATGTVTSNSSTATSKSVDVSAGTVIHNMCNKNGMNGKLTVLNVALYRADNTFIERINIQNKSSFTINSETAKIQIIFGYLSSSGNTETLEDIATNFHVRFVKRVKEFDESKLNAYLENTAFIVQANNYQNRLPDLSEIKTNSIYRLNFAVDSTNIPANSPYISGWKSNSIVTLITMVGSSGTLKLGDTQIFIASDGIYSRVHGKENIGWLAWTKIGENENEDSKKIIVDPNGNGDYTSFTEAVGTAQWQQNAFVYVKRGTYDAIAETKALLGDDCFDNWSKSYGPTSLRNGIHIYCEPGTVLEAHYTGNNENVMMYYSPINGKYDFTLENLKIVASRTRYCIHDDLYDDTTPYKHVYKNVECIMDNRNAVNWDRKQAVGGGFGVNGYVEFENCYFKSYGLSESAHDGYASFSYHNSPSANAQSKLVVRNCYFDDDSTILVSYHGESTLISEAFISGCSLGHPIQNGPTTQSSSINNINIIDCNNVIRSN